MVIYSQRLIFASPTHSSGIGEVRARKGREQMLQLKNESMVRRRSDYSLQQQQILPDILTADYEQPRDDCNDDNLAGN